MVAFFLSNDFKVSYKNSFQLIFNLKLEVFTRS